MTKEQAFATARKYAQKTKQEFDPSAEIYLFGSAARDEMTEHSDIDIAVVSQKYQGNKIDNRAMLFMLAQEISWDIEPHPFTLSDWKYSTPFTKAIRRDGILL